METPYFFLHIPRTAGTTLNSILEQHFPPDHTLRIYDDVDYKKYRYADAAALSHVQFITGHLLLERTDPPSIYGMPVRVLTLLREPIGRLVSEYHFLRTWEHNHLYHVLNDNNITFSQYLQSREKLLYYRGKNFMTRCIAGYDVQDDPYPQKALAIAKHNLEHVFSFVGIQERFIESLVMLRNMLGIENILHEKRNALNKNAHTPPSEQDIALAHELNRADVALYAFACELFDARVQAQGASFTQQVRQVTEFNVRYQKIADLLHKKVVAGEPSTRGNIVLPKDGAW